MSSGKVGAVMVVGAGIAGIQASLDLAESGYYVYLVEQSPAIGGTMPMLDKTFPTNDCSMCILSPKLVQCGRHLNIETLTNSVVSEVEGEPGNFKVTVSQKARYVDPEKCTGCGSCAEECPVKVDDEFNQGLGKRKAIYKSYAQAYPNAYAIDSTKCLKIKKPKACGKCLEVCQADAIDHEMQDETLEIEVGSIILCPGFEKFDASNLDYYGYGKFPNVVTSLEFERILSASGPFGGHMQRPYDGKEPRKIAWIQCVGSRNCRIENGYCSSVCCMYAIKEAVIAKEHSKEELDTTIFYMDMRTYGKDFEKYYDRARNEQGVNFVRSRIFQVSETDDESKNLTIRYADETGAVYTEEFDMVVLSVGLEPSQSVMELGKKLGLELNRFGFAETAPLSGVNSSREGIYVAGAFGGPKDIPETVMEASAAAGSSASLLGDVRGTMIKEKEFPPEKDVSGEDPRIGVFVCHCGVNIGSVVDVPAVVQTAAKLPGVEYAGEFLYVCSQDSQAAIREAIEEHKLNRVVVASCSPRTHKPLFQETMREAGLNAYLFEMANIRDQCSWVHMNEPEKATEKAKDLVKMVVAKASLLEPVKQISVGVNPKVLVIGGGVTGMTNALSLAEQGYSVHIVEKSNELGGNALRIKHGFKGEDVQGFVNDLIDKVKSSDKIEVSLGTEVSEVSGYVGNFKTTLSTGDVVEHGVTVIAIGGREYKPTEYLYGENDAVFTQLELEEALSSNNPKVTQAKNIVLIQCVGSRDTERPYCSRVCCNKSVKLALKLKEINPDVNVFILYRDVRTYGFNEENYREARQKGVIFIRYNEEDKPNVEAAENGLKVTVTDHVLGEPVVIEADAVGLAAAILAPEDNARMNQLFKVPLNADGFFLEAHMKLRPVDTAADGIFIAGLAHGPKSMEENISQAKAAAGRALTILSKDSLDSSGVVAVVQPDKCAACLTCVRLCPFNAPRINNYAAEIEAVLCQGCGSCAGECPNKAITLQSYKDVMLMQMVDGLYKEVR
jgi:heterodisulfide reductase subunit A